MQAVCGVQQAQPQAMGQTPTLSRPLGVHVRPPLSGRRAGAAPSAAACHSSSSRRRSTHQAGALPARVLGGKVYLDPVEEEAAAFAPATVANLGPGFDWMGCAVEGEGDTVVARVLPGRPGEVEIAAIRGDGGRLPLDAAKNCCGVAAREALRALGAPSCGVSLEVHKGLPLGSGMGSSAASAAAAAWAVNTLFGQPLSKMELVPAGLAAEATVSGFHADNIAPALLGGFVLIRSCEPLDIQQLPWPRGSPLWLALVTPQFEAPTAEMRAALPAKVPLKDAVRNCALGGSLVAGILLGDAPLVGAALGGDVIVEPVRGPLIPGFAAVKEAAMAAGAFGCTISGAGPTCVAVVSDPAVGQRCAEAMADAFRRVGRLDVQSARVTQVDLVGAKAL